MNSFMRSVFNMFSGVITTILLLAGAAVAQNMPDDVSPYPVHPRNEEMWQTLEQQQEQLEQQEQRLLELRQRVQELSGSDEQNGDNNDDTPFDGESRESTHREARQRDSAPPEAEGVGRTPFFIELTL